MDPAGASVSNPPATVVEKKPAKGKKPAKDQTPEERKIESDKRATRRATARNRREAAKMEQERMKEEALYREAMVAANTDKLVHGAAERAVIILKQEALISAYGGGQAGSGALSTSSVTSTPSGRPQPLPRTQGPHTPPPANQARASGGLSCLGEPRQTSSGSDPKSIDLNRAPQAGEATPLASKRARRISTDDLPPLVNLFDGMTGQFPPENKTEYLGVDADAGEAIMSEMINEGGHAGLEGFTEDETQPPSQQGDAYDINGHPLFGHDDMASQGVSQDASTQATAAAMAATLGAGIIQPKKSHRTANFSTREDTVLCEGWVEVSQDPIHGAEQKGYTFWSKVGKFFHEHRKFPPNPFFSDRSEVSLAKRWGVIHAECSKFQGSFELVGRKQVSGHTQLDMVLRALEHFKACNENKAFTLSHCWNVLRGAKKWELSYAAWLDMEAKKKGKAALGSPGVVDLDEGGEQDGAGPSSVGRIRRPVGGVKASKAELARLAAQNSFQDTLRELMGKKESAIAEREDRRRKEKELTAKTFADLQAKALEVDESNAKARLLEAEAKAKAIEAEAKSKLLECQALVMAEENKIMLTDLDTIADPDRRAWFARRQAEIRASDA